MVNSGCLLLHYDVITIEKAETGHRERVRATFLQINWLKRYFQANKFA